MPKIIEVETLRSITANLAMSFRPSIAEIAKRHNVGRQWVYDWEDKLDYHGVQGCKFLSDELLVALRDNEIFTPEPRAYLKRVLEDKWESRRKAREREEDALKAREPPYPWDDEEEE